LNKEDLGSVCGKGDDARYETLAVGSVPGRTWSAPGLRLVLRTRAWPLGAYLCLSRPVRASIDRSGFCSGAMVLQPRPMWLRNACRGRTKERSRRRIVDRYEVADDRGWSRDMQRQRPRLVEVQTNKEPSRQRATDCNDVRRREKPAFSPACDGAEDECRADGRCSTWRKQRKGVSVRKKGDAETGGQWAERNVGVYRSTCPAFFSSLHRQRCNHRRAFIMDLQYSPWSWSLLTQPGSRWPVVNGPWL